VINGTIYYEPILTTYMRVLFFLILPNLICFVVTRFMESKPPIISLVHNIYSNVVISFFFIFYIRCHYFDAPIMKLMLMFASLDIDGPFRVIMFVILIPMIICSIGFFYIIIYCIYPCVYPGRDGENIKPDCEGNRFCSCLCNFFHHPCCDPPNDIWGVSKEINRFYLPMVCLKSEYENNLKQFPIIKVHGKTGWKKNNNGEITYVMTKTIKSIEIPYESWEEEGICPSLPDSPIIHYECLKETQFDEVIQERIDMARSELMEVISLEEHDKFVETEVEVTSFHNDLLASQGICYHKWFGRALNPILMFFGYSYIFNTFWRTKTKKVVHKTHKKVSHDNSLRNCYKQIGTIILNNEEVISP